MEQKNKGRILVLAVIVSTTILLILHSIELPFQEYPHKIVLFCMRIALLAPLLLLLYFGFSIGRSIMAILSIIGIAFFVVTSFQYSDMFEVLHYIHAGSMAVLLVFNALVLICSPDVGEYIRQRRRVRCASA